MQIRVGADAHDRAAFLVRADEHGRFCGILVGCDGICDGFFGLAVKIACKQQIAADIVLRRQRRRVGLRTAHEEHLRDLLLERQTVRILLRRRPADLLRRGFRLGLLDGRRGRRFVLCGGVRAAAGRQSGAEQTQQQRKHSFFHVRHLVCLHYTREQGSCKA